MNIYQTAYKLFAVSALLFLLGYSNSHATEISRSSVVNSTTEKLYLAQVSGQEEAKKEEVEEEEEPDCD